MQIGDLAGGLAARQLGSHYKIGVTKEILKVQLGNESVRTPQHAEPY